MVDEDHRTGEDAAPVLPYATVGAPRPYFPPGFLKATFLGASPLVLTEFIAAGLAYYTDGEVVQTLQFMAIIGGNAVALATLPLRSRRVTVLALLLVWAAIVPRQVALGVRLHGLRHEARSIVQHLESVRRESGDYPPDLSGYTFQRPWTQGRFRYNGTEVRWWVIQPGIAYWYNARDGYCYYPD